MSRDDIGIVEPARYKTHFITGEMRRDGLQDGNPESILDFGLLLRTLSTSRFALPVPTGSNQRTRPMNGETVWEPFLGNGVKARLIGL